MNKLESLKGWFSDKNGAIVALSGGVDSALVAYAAYHTLGNAALAVTADYKTLAQEELESAARICKEIGIRHVIITYDELENEDFVKNDSNRCFHCRTELSAHLRDVSRKEGIDLIVDGTNTDDLGEYRPGIVALKNNDVRSPLVEVGLSKSDIRSIARSAGLSVYDRPSNSCLASRIPWGQRVTAERLARIEVGETFVRQMFGAKQVRVRDMDGTAKIELGRDEVFLLSQKEKLDSLTEKLLSIGFSSVEVDPDGYRPGKINVIAD
ncbi:ATP-dependent sacrificial sulfur transferase LarE [Candidatus Nitrosotenuis cloacae]|uniref:ATP-dependent sacrificial sulfur transferase LarE n=1 Tax=Candidatus Nitrosotenuis cloacae TaxID=1603555 RepID=UPI0022815372|nr:ATP-dependent sacrificial sulfur transferase LarE [Candidatus Nitrosotenuis cloacae]